MRTQPCAGEGELVFRLASHISCPLRGVERNISNIPHLLRLTLAVTSRRTIGTGLSAPDQNPEHLFPPGHSLRALRLSLVTGRAALQAQGHQRTGESCSEPFHGSGTANDFLMRGFHFAVNNGKLLSFKLRLGDDDKIAELIVRVKCS